MHSRAILAAVLTLSLAGAAAAGGKRVVTPRVLTPPSGSLICSVVNASDKKTVEVIVFIKSNLGTIVSPPGQPTLEPGRSAFASSTADTAAYCEVEILSGSPKDLRVAVFTLDATGNVLSSLPGY